MTVDPRTVQTVRQADERLGPEGEPLRTLLWTAAAVRPLDEVAALVGLLRRTGAVADPADEALRAAAVSRPVDEVRRLVALLNEPSVRGVSPVPAPLPQSPSADGSRGPSRVVRVLRRPVGPAGRPPAAGRAQREARPRDAVLPVAEVCPPRPGAGGLAPNVAAGPGAPSPVLRWPAALALLLIGLVHLPRHLVSLRPGDAGPLALAVTSLCLALAVRVLARDTAWVWAASAVVGLGVVAMHALAGNGDLALVHSSLVGAFGWARVLAPTCAVVVVGLAGAALLPHRAARTAAGT